MVWVVFRSTGRKKRTWRGSTLGEEACWRGFGVLNRLRETEVLGY